MYALALGHRAYISGNELPTALQPLHVNHRNHCKYCKTFLLYLLFVQGPFLDASHGHPPHHAY